MRPPSSETANLHSSYPGADTVAVIMEQGPVPEERLVSTRVRDPLTYLPYAFVALSLIAVVLSHSPWLPLPVQAAGHSFSNLVGQEVRWTMFSADPRAIAVDLWAEVEYTDGSRRRWSIDRSMSELRLMRWSVWTEVAVLQAPQDQMEALAGWLAARAEKPVARIEIFGSERGPGVAGEERRPPHVELLYTWERRR